MSNPKTLLDQFREILSELTNKKTFNFSAAKVAREAGISLYKVNAVRNNRSVRIEIDELRTLQDYYSTKVTVLREVQGYDADSEDDKIAALEKEIEQLRAESKEKDKKISTLLKRVEILEKAESRKGDGAKT